MAKAKAKTAKGATKAINREAWLQGLTERLRPAFEAAGAPLPEAVHVSVGWPTTRALSKKRRAVGQCVAGKHSSDGAPHVFVSPILEQREADHTLVHELVHAAVGHEAGHGKAFRVVAVALGLEGRMTATTCGEELRARLDALAEELGPYPHPQLTLAKKEKKGSRMRKAVCGCGRILRLSRKEAERGPILCGLCEEPYVLEEDPDGESAAAKAA